MIYWFINIFKNTLRSVHSWSCVRNTKWHNETYIGYLYMYERRLFRFLLLPSFTNTWLFKMIVGVLTTCHTQYTWERSICVFLFNRTTLHVFVTYLTGALYVHPLWFYKHQHENRVRSKLLVACQRWWFLIYVYRNKTVAHTEHL